MGKLLEKKTLWWLLWSGSILVILGPTMLPLSNFVGHSHWDQVRWIPFYGDAFKPLDIGGNVALFAPFGFCLRRALGNPSRKRACAFILLAAAGLATGVEFFQVYCHNRVPSTTDICSNMLGALVGALLSMGG